MVFGVWKFSKDYLWANTEAKLSHQILDILQGVIEDILLVLQSSHNWQLHQN